LKKLYNFITYLFFPGNMALAGFALPMLWFPTTLLPWHFWPVLISLFVIFPVLGILWLIQRGYIDNIHVYHRGQRNRSYQIAFAYACLVWVYLHFVPVSKTAYLDFAKSWILEIMISLFLVQAINSYALKASAHMMGVGGFLALCFALYHQGWPSGPWIVNALILCVLVYAARKGLSAHSHKELWVGFGLGFITTFAIFSV
jgi:hypothetical protein